MENKAILASLLAVQRDLKVEKGQTNKFGGYNYRSAEDIIEKAKPLCIENGLLLTTTDDLQELGGRIYLTVTATVTDIVSGESFSTKAMAREPQAQKGMTESQLTGTAESYAKKRALGNLFAIDDTKDPDSNEYRQETSSRAAGARSGGNAGNYTNHGDNGAQTGAQAAKTANDPYDRKHLNARLMEEFQRTGASSAEMTAVIKAKYGKDSAKALSELDLKDLCDNLETYLAELMQKQAG